MGCMGSKDAADKKADAPKDNKPAAGAAPADSKPAGAAAKWKLLKYINNFTLNHKFQQSSFLLSQSHF